MMSYNQQKEHQFFKLKLIILFFLFYLIVARFCPLALLINLVEMKFKIESKSECQFS